VISYQDTNVLLILMWPYSSILMCYWLACDLIPAYWCVIESDVASFLHNQKVQYTVSMIFFRWVSIVGHQWWNERAPVRGLIQVIWKFSLPSRCLQMCYWLACDLIPAYWCVIDSDVASFLHTVLLILTRPHSSILMCYWIWCGLIPAYLKINSTLVCWNEVTW
jgi:hypothetical protein